MIDFNLPYLTGKEVNYINQAVQSGKISGNGLFTRKCQVFFEQRYNFGKCLLTTSCTDALEMCAILLNIQPGDEIIVPSFTFVSTALAFVRQGARIVFADSRSDHPGIDEAGIEKLITPRTKAIVPVHYAGVACNMDIITDIAERHGLFVVEDAAQAIDSFYIGKDKQKRALGSFGHLAVFSFHETKNIQCGEGGMLVVNDSQFEKRAEIIWEKGTNRAEYFRGEINKYGWVDTGSSFLPSEITAAFLWAQLEYINDIQKRRIEIWEWYNSTIRDILKGYSFEKPHIPEYGTNNGHMYYLVCKDLAERSILIKDLKSKGIQAVFHYQSLHKSPFYESRHDGRNLPQSEKYSDCIVRLPLFYDLDTLALLEKLQ